MSDLCFEIPIPVAPHIFQYMNALYGNHYALTKNDSLGVFIITMLQKENKILNDDLKPIKNKKYYKLKVSQSIYEKQGILLDGKAIRYIGEIIDKYFREQCFTTAILDHERFGYEYLTSIKDYCKFFGITDDDINPESLYRQFFRKRDENSPNFVSNLCRFASEKQRVSAS